MARRVGSKINRHWAPPIELRVSTGTINLVRDFKYLVPWLLDCMKDFEIRNALAWKACIRSVQIWKSNSISSTVAIKLFRACVESTRQYNSVSWTRTDTLSK
jgi:hypothetical protein